MALQLQLCACREHGQGRTRCSACSHWVPLPVLVLLVAAILWCTPLPDKVYYSCDRPCHDLEWPMICRFKVTVEAHCPVNLTSCGAGGLLSSPLVANRMIPGPTLKVCENDIVVVDLVNLAMGQSMALHWGRQTHRRDPFMDGAPMVTQCPVNALNSFQYKFRATGAGTHLWSATGSPYADTVFGALVVRQSAKRDPHRALFDEDEHVFSFSIFRDTILINGEYVHERHRLRLLYSGQEDLPLAVSLQQHDLIVIAVDGQPVHPLAARSVTLQPGECVDVVVLADRPQGTYPLEVRTSPGRGGVSAHPAPARALLTYAAKRPQNKEENPSKVEVIDTSLGEAADIDSLHDIAGLEQIPERLAKDHVDVRLYLPFHNDLVSKPGFCNISLVLPAAPLLSQLQDAEAATCLEGCSTSSAPLCRGEAAPAPGPEEEQGHRECTHIVRLPLGNTVELILADQGGAGAPARSTFFLHGNSFWLVGEAPGPPPRGPWQELAVADQRGELLHRDARRPAASRPRDSVSVPRGGVVALRFVADNPGYWLLREKAFYKRPAGLGVILQVGDPSDMSPVPPNFPKCGSFVGPDFFLI